MVRYMLKTKATYTKNLDMWPYQGHRNSFGVNPTMQYHEFHHKNLKVTNLKVE